MTSTSCWRRSALLVLPGCRFVGGQQSGLAGCKLPPLFKRGAPSCLSRRQRQRDPWGASPPPSAPTYLPTLGFGLHPAIPGWGFGACVVVCALRLHPAVPGSGLGVCVCACTRVSAAPRHSWLKCWGVCVFVCALRLYPADPGWGVRHGCVCLGSGCGCAPPLLAGVLGCVCVCLRAPHVPCGSSVGCAAWVCVFWLGFGLRSASPGWGVGVCVCLCARSACTPPLLARVCCVGVCVS